MTTTGRTIDVHDIPRIRHREAMAITAVENTRLNNTLAGLEDGDWTRPTDCTAWDIRSLVVHLIASAQAQASPVEFLRQLRAGRPLTAQIGGSHWVDGHRAADFTIDARSAVAQLDEVRPDVVFVTSPNNPTGTAVDLDTIAAQYDATSGVLVVDEAYAEFARPGTPSALSLLPGRPRLVVSRTMSKAFGMAGLRLGYLAADEAVVEALQLVRLPYHLSSLTQAAARTALAHTDELLATVDAVKAQRDRIVAALPALGLTSVPSDANFVLFGRFADAPAAWQALLERDVLVRDVGLAGWLRVTAGTPEETDAFLTALGAVAPEHRAPLGGSAA